MPFSHTAPRIEFNELEDEIQCLRDKERKDLESDLYGNSERSIETETLRVSSLEELQMELNFLESTTLDTKVYQQALQQCPAYATSESFLLSFLRAEDFHVQNAAQRLVSYWNEKHKLFGEAHTYSQITLDSLQETDLKVIKNGGFTLLPNDDHGRIVLHRDRIACQVKLRGRESVLRAFLYLVHVAIDNDDTAQQKGMVILSASRYAFQLEDHDRLYMKKLFQLISCLPIRVVSYHIVGAFISSNFSAMVMPSVHWLMGNHMSLRHRVHNGSSNQELQTSLALYGITQLPLFLGGNVQLDGQLWLEERRRIEKMFTSVNA